MKILCISLLAFILLINTTGIVYGAADAIKKTETPRPVGGCSQTLDGDCGDKVSLPESPKDKIDGSAASSSSANSSGNNNTKTVIPDPLSGELCEDLLGCKDKNLNGMNLKPGVQESYVYRKMIPQFIKLILNISGGVAVLMLVYSGYLYLASAGKEEMMQKAVKTITFTILGLLVITLSRALVAIVENLPLG